MANTHSLDLEASSSQYAGIAAASWVGLDFTSSFTLAVWVRPESISGDMTIIGVANRTGSGGGYFIRNTSAANTLDAKYVSSGVDISTTATGQLANATWAHIAFTHNDSTDTDVLYVNGSAVTTETSRTNNPSTNSTHPFRLGATPSPADFFDGLLDDARAWSRALSGAEIADLYANPCTFSDGASLQGKWLLDNDYTDESGNGNTLTASGSPVFSETVAYVCPTTAIKTLNGLAYASVKTKNGLAVASIKNINGLA